MYLRVYCSVPGGKGGPFSSKNWALFQNVLQICDSIPAGIKLAASASAAASAPGAPAPAAALAALEPPVPAHVLCLCQKGHIYIKRDIKRDIKRNLLKRPTNLYECMDKPAPAAASAAAAT